MGFGRTTFYFHGTPGSKAELELFGGDARPDWIVLDRSAVGSSPERDFDALADQVRAKAGGHPIRLVAFSLGTHSGLEVAHRLAGEDVEICLISAAAPLQAGNFLGEMAGGAVFRLAQRRPQLFGLLAKAQGLVTRASSSAMTKMLLGSARQSDRALIGDAVFREGMDRNLRLALGQRGAAYRRDIAAYVADWRAILPAIHHPVHFWHGMADNWSPPSMAAALADLLPMAEEPQYIEGISHYSTLQRAISDIVARTEAVEDD